MAGWTPSGDSLRGSDIVRALVVVANCGSASPSVRRFFSMISRTNFRLAWLLLLAASVCAAQVSVPDTPAGRTLQTWLDVFNSGDRGRMENYVKTIDSSIPADG